MLLPFVLLISSEEERNTVQFLFEDCYLHLVAFANQIVHNRADAEDAVMNAFIYICDHSDLLHDRSINEVRSLLIICVKRNSIDIYRKNKTNNKHLLLDDDSIDYSATVSDVEFSDLGLEIANQMILEKALNQLDEMYRAPIILKYYHFLRNNEIVELLKIDSNTLNARLFRAKKYLKEILQKGVQDK